MKIITTITTITNTISVEDALVADMTEDQIARKLENDPEYFGRDTDPAIDPDRFISIEDV